MNEIDKQHTKQDVGRSVCCDQDNLSYNCEMNEITIHQFFTKIL